MRSFVRPTVVGALALGLGVLSLHPGAALAEVPTAPARCDWIGAATAPMTHLGSSQSLLRMKVEQDLGNPEATHGAEDTVQINYAYDSSFLEPVRDQGRARSCTRPAICARGTSASSTR